MKSSSSSRSMSIQKQPKKSFNTFYYNIIFQERAEKNYSAVTKKMYYKCQNIFFES